MSSKERVLYNDHMVTHIMVDDTTVVEKGDFICAVIANDVTDDATLTLGYGCPPTYLVDGGDAAANRALLVAQLIGIALEAKGTTDNDKMIAVGYNGTFILDQKTAIAIHIGDNIEAYADDTSCEDQTIVEGDTSVIATCIETKTSTSDTEVKVFLQPPLMNV